MDRYGGNYKGRRSKFIHIGDLAQWELDDYTRKNLRQEQQRRDLSDLEAGLLVRDPERQDLLDILI